MCTAVLIGWDPATPPSPCIWTPVTRALLVSKDRRYLFVTPCPPSLPLAGSVQNYAKTTVNFFPGSYVFFGNGSWKCLVLLGWCARQGMEQNCAKKLVFQNSQINFVRTSKVVFSDTIWKYFSCCVLRKWFKTKVSCSSKQSWERVFFPEMLQNKIKKFASIFVPCNGIPSCLLFCGMVQSENLLLVLFHCTEFRAFFSSAK
jgi:hypothetical protein